MDVAASQLYSGFIRKFGVGKLSYNYNSGSDEKVIKSKAYTSLDGEVSLYFTPGLYYIQVVANGYSNSKYTTNSHLKTKKSRFVAKFSVKNDDF